MQDNRTPESSKRNDSPFEPSPHRDTAELVDPESTTNEETLRMACDQSIAARNLLYHPGRESMEAIQRCTHGVRQVLRVIDATSDPVDNLKNGEILITMFTRFMADGGAGRIPGFNAQVRALGAARARLPEGQQSYNDKVLTLANTCRARMDGILERCVQEGPVGAIDRQALLTFVGDLGGFEPDQIGFGPTYPAPICGDPAKKDDPRAFAKDAAEKVYNTLVMGLFNAAGAGSTSEFVTFADNFKRARLLTASKPDGVLSATVHTITKATERVLVKDSSKERQGLLNQGGKADDIISATTQIDQSQRLLSVAWPQFTVPKKLLEGVDEPVTGHVSGSFGEIAVMTAMLCGARPETFTPDEPAGQSGLNPRAIASLASAVLMTAGYHSAVEIFQPMSTFCGQPSHELLGSITARNSKLRVGALKDFAEWKERYPGVDPSGFPDIDLIDIAVDCSLNPDELRDKADKLWAVSTKEQDFISLSQGKDRGATLATLEVCGVLAEQSQFPMQVGQLLSLRTREEMIGVSGSVFSKAREVSRLIGQLPISEETTNLRARALQLCEVHIIVSPEEKSQHTPDEVGMNAALKQIVQEVLAIKVGAVLPAAGGGGRVAAGGGGRVAVGAEQADKNELRTIGEIRSNLAAIVGIDFKSRYQSTYKKPNSNEGKIYGPKSS